MGCVSSVRLPFAVLAFSLVTCALSAPTRAASAGYLWLKTFSADAAGSNGQVTLSGQFVNLCVAGLPSGSLLRIQFDQGTLLEVRITAGVGQGQHFSGTVTVPNVPPPQNNTTAYRFSILVPGGNQGPASSEARPDMKTSPCLVTPAPGTPSQP